MSGTQTPAEKLHQRISSRKAVIGVVGLGYVGTPLALAFADAGFSVVALDVNADRVNTLNQGNSPLPHVDAAPLRAALVEGRLLASADFHRLREVDAVLVCVPTPLTHNREPDLSHVEAATAQVASHLHPGQLVILESTTYPGTTAERVRPILEKGGFVVGKDVFLAYSPEREDPGNTQFSTRTIPKVVGADDSTSGDLAQLLYDQVVQQTVRVSSTRVAEATKLTENVFRAVNIALVNELKMVFDHMGLDIWQVLDAAESKPFGFMRFNPGPGWGGHCIALDPFYLSWKAQQSGPPPRFVELAGQVNMQMPSYVVGKVLRALAPAKSLSGAHIMILGVAYKKDVDDARESPAFDVMSELSTHGTHLSYHDPHVPELLAHPAWPLIPLLKSQPLTVRALEAADAVVVITNHTRVNYELVLRHAKVIVDTRGVYPDAAPNVIRA